MKWLQKLLKICSLGTLYSIGKTLKNEPPIDPAVFYTKLQESIANRLLDCGDANLAQWARVLDQTQ